MASPKFFVGESYGVEREARQVAADYPDTAFLMGSSGGPEGEGRGFYLQMEGFENGRLQTAARAVGVMQAAYEAALDYAQNRVVFGKAVGDSKLEAEGKGDRAAGKVQNAVGGIKDAVRDIGKKDR